MSEIMRSLRTAIGEEARVEIYERVVKLYEKIMLSENISAASLSKNAFEMMTLSILDGLAVSIKQMAKLSGEEQIYESEYVDRERFRSLIAYLLKSGMITYHEYETALKDPGSSSLPWILNSIKDEAEDLLSLLVIGHPGEIEEKVKKRELELLIAAR